MKSTCGQKLTYINMLTIHVQYLGSCIPLFLVTMGLPLCAASLVFQQFYVITMGIPDVRKHICDNNKQKMQ